MRYDDETTSMSIRVSKKLKKEADELFNDLGINTSSAVNMFLAQCVSEDAIPFRVSRNEKTPSDELKEALKEADEIRKDRSRKGYSTIREVMDELHK